MGIFYGNWDLRWRFSGGFKVRPLSRGRHRRCRDLDCDLVAAVDFDALHCAAATPEHDAHRVGTSVEGGFDESGVLAQGGFEVVEHATVARWVDHVRQ